MTMSDVIDVLRRGRYRTVVVVHDERGSRFRIVTCDGEVIEGEGDPWSRDRSQIVVKRRYRVVRGEG